MRKRSLSKWGGIAGIVIAAAGGVGVAVGTYTLPDPTRLHIFTDPYARVDQHAIAVWKTEDGIGSRELRIEATRGASAQADAEASLDGVTPAHAEDVNAYFRAQLKTCPSGAPEEECVFEVWTSSVALDAIEFDPAMGGAHFAGAIPCESDSACDPEVSCTFDVTWNAEGTPAPFEGRTADAHLGPDGANEKIEGFAEVSRVAPAEISTSCAGSTPSAPGYLSVGLRRYLVGRSSVNWS